MYTLENKQMSPKMGAISKGKACLPTIYFSGVGKIQFFQTSGRMGSPNPEE